MGRQRPSPPRPNPIELIASRHLPATLGAQICASAPLRPPKQAAASICMRAAAAAAAALSWPSVGQASGLWAACGRHSGARLHLPLSWRRMAEPTYRCPSGALAGAFLCARASA